MCGSLTLTLPLTLTLTPTLTPTLTNHLASAVNRGDALSKGRLVDEVLFAVLEHVAHDAHVALAWSGVGVGVRARARVGIRSGLGSEQG